MELKDYLPFWKLIQHKKTFGIVEWPIIWESNEFEYLTKRGRGLKMNGMKWEREGEGSGRDTF